MTYFESFQIGPGKSAARHVGKKKDPTLPKQASNPFSTGGGGVNFETRVQAAFALLMLAGGQCPCLPNWPIDTITLQARRAGFEIDDVIVAIKDPATNISALLLAQIKHDLSFTKSNDTFTEVISAAWRDFNVSTFTPGRDAIAIITGPLSTTDIQFQTLLEWARSSATSTEYFEKVRLAQFSSATKINKQDVLEHHLELANKFRPNDDSIWMFMRSLYILSFDFDATYGMNTYLARCIVGQYSTQPTGVWSQIIDAVQMLNQNAGTVAKNTLPSELVAVFTRRPMVAFSEFAALANFTSLPSEPLTTTAYPAELAKVHLIGSWDEDLDGDRDAVASIVGESYESFVGKLRLELRREGSPLRYRNGIWSIVDREAALIAAEDMIYDQDVEQLSHLAVKVLGTEGGE